jgi:hypothetical protein
VSQTRGGRQGNRSEGDRLTKAERKDQARQEREEIQTQMARRKRTRVGGLIVGLLAAGIVIALLVTLSGDTTEPGDGSTDPNALPGLMTSPSPWGPNNEQLAERLAILDFPAFEDNEGHRHVRMFLFVHGDPVTVPADIGFPGNIASPLHTHDDTGTLHVEAADMTWVPSLGQFLDSWGLRSTAECLGAYCADGEDSLRAYVDGELFEGDPRTIAMEDQVAVTLVFGSEDEIPDEIPDSFTYGA